MGRFNTAPRVNSTHLLASEVGAHDLTRISRAPIVRGQPYDETEAFAITPASIARRLKHLQNHAHALNLKLVPA